jgi:Domain of unknown function DUF29
MPGRVTLYDRDSTPGAASRRNSCALEGWRYQPEKHSPSWETSIRVQRNRLADHLDDNPSLKPLLPQALASAYRDAALGAVAETGLAGATFLEACPWTVEQVSDGAFWPG